jgi:hypothetical protein
MRIFRLLSTLVLFGLYALSIVGQPANAATLIHAYNLNGNFLDALGGPSLVPNGGTLSAHRYTYGIDQGLTLTSGLVDTTDYSIVLVFEIDSLLPFWQKIIDFEQLGRELGLYTRGDRLAFWTLDSRGGSDVITPNTDIHVVLARDSAAQVVNIYLNGVLQSSVVDTSGQAISTSNVLTFFQDDPTAGVEAGSGSVDCIAVYDEALSPAEISNLASLAVCDTFAPPIVQPIVGFFNIFTTDAGEPQVNENIALQPLVDFSRTITSGFATSHVNLHVINDDAGAAVISLRDLMDVDSGGSESGVSFAMQFDLLEEATYEISGGMSGSSVGIPDEFVVQLQTSVQFNGLSPFNVLLVEGDNSAPFNAPSVDVDFTINEINEGDLGGNTPSLGSRTGLLAPGRYGLDGTAWIFSRGGGFSATAQTELSIRLTPTRIMPEFLLEQLSNAVNGVGPGKSLTDKVELAQT